MRCMICNNNFIIKRDLSTLFKIKNYNVCNVCYTKYKIDITYNVIPLNRHKLIIYSLFSEKYYFKRDPFNEEFSRLLSYVINNCDTKENVLVYFNLRINDFCLQTFSILSKMINNDLIIVCNYCEI